MGLSVFHEIKHSRCSRGTFLFFFSPPTPQPLTTLPEVPTQQGPLILGRGIP